MFTNGLLEQAETLLAYCKKHRKKIATTESCTGGMLSALLTSISGSSQVFDMGFVTYSNAAKTELLDVPPALIEQYGAVSDAVARAMAEGALAKANADLALSITGIAGPRGGTDEKPVGLVFIGCATEQKTICERFQFSGNRHEIRMQAVAHAVRLAAAHCQF